MLTPGLSLLRLAFRRSMASAPQSSGVSKKKVECFYDVLSPYSGIGFEIICRYRSLWNLDLHFRPVFFMGILKAIGSQPPAMLPKKGDYILKDIIRMGKYCQVPINLPKDFVNSVVVKGSLPAMRFITAVDIAEPQFLESVSRELWMRLWSRDEDIVQPESILAAAEKAGLPSGKSQELLKMSTSPEVKNRLKETTDEALNRGAFGVPSFIIQIDGKPQLFFGSDRIEVLGNALGEKWLGPVPTSSKL
ncbi:glutathione S-transferase kappa 1-like [Crotalus tigris]|uniref:glutathione S-transferase kappa 1-like n=1 Tax=Crotalus tigris TaxID=88082 RepID=UPI00192F81CD|nr:glutathione S-transferase kappa 1-like [Crotalus tigris]